MAEMMFCDFNEKHSLSRRLLPPGNIKDCNWEVCFLLRNISAKLQNGGNRLSAYTNNWGSGYTRAPVQSPVPGKLAQFAETNSTVLISSATSLDLRSSIQTPADAPSPAPHGAPGAVCFSRHPLVFKVILLKHHPPRPQRAQDGSPQKDNAHLLKFLPGH